MKSITVIGAGVMGRGIAYSASIHGFNVTLQDINKQALQSAHQQMIADFEKAFKRGYAQESDLAALQSIHFTTSLEEAAKHADFVIEAVLENIQLKYLFFSNSIRFVHHMRF